MAGEDPILLGIGATVENFPVPFILSGLAGGSVVQPGPEDPIMLGIGGGVANFPAPFILSGLNPIGVTSSSAISIVSGIGKYSPTISGEGRV